MEAAAGIEPANSGFADRCLNHLATPPPILLRELRSLRSTRNFGTSRAAPNPSQFWSGRGDSNSRPSAWQADALPTELLPHLVPNGAGKGIRTPDPQLGKLMLYRLSYSRPWPTVVRPAPAPAVKPAVQPAVEPVVEPVVKPAVQWWAVQGLNLRPLPCEESALPAELTARFAGHTLSGAEGGIRTRTNRKGH